MDKLKEYLVRHRADLDVDSPASDTWEHIGSRTSARSGLVRWVRYAAVACVIALAGVGLWLVTRDNKAPADTAKHNVPTKIGDAARAGSTSAAPEHAAPGYAVTGHAVTGHAVPEREKTSREEEKTSDAAVAASTPKRVQHKARPPKREEPADEIDAIDKSYSSLIDYQLRTLRATPLYAENGDYFSFYVEQFKEMDNDEKQVRKDISVYGLTSEFLEQLINVYQQKLNLLKNLQAEVNKMNNKVREKQSPTAKTEVHYLNI